jgi:hypothetical protein
MIKNLLLKNDTIYFLKSLSEDNTEGVYSIYMKKDSPDVVTCIFDAKHGNSIKGYLDYCNIKPKSVVQQRESKSVIAELKPSFVEFHLENLEDWLVEEKIFITEDMKIIE